MKLNQFTPIATSKVSIYIPSTSDVDNNIDNTEYVNAAAEMLSHMFGGATAENVKGFYFSDMLNKLVAENTTKVYSCCSLKDFEKHEETILDWCMKLKKELNQECIGIELDNAMYYI